MEQKNALAQRVSSSLTDALQNYVYNLNGQPCTRLYQSTMDLVEKQLIYFSLEQCKGNISATAKMLGISRTTLTRKITLYHLQPNNRTK